MGDSFNNLSAFSIALDPLLPPQVLVGGALLTFLMLFMSLSAVGKGRVFRFMLASLFLLTLSNPVLVSEKREPTKDVALLIIDKSPSQQFGQRMGRTIKAVKYVKSSLKELKSIDLRVIEIDGGDEDIPARTAIAEKVKKELSGIPEKRRAGIIVISDGQIHDIPELSSAREKTNSLLKSLGPVHVLLSGTEDEKDRNLIIEKAPAYAIIGQDAQIEFSVKDTKNLSGNRAITTVVTTPSGDEILKKHEPGEKVSMKVPVEHAGQNVFEIKTQEVPGELTYVNNKSAVLINGVRDRLKVLLISGKPHTGERTWRNILTSDPAVDLVHFTILREPHKLNNVPQSELSLIPFPFRELFEVKIYDFDLIIFDRYRANRIMPEYYFSNITKYVRQGGALLEASGPSFASGQSIFDTALGEILPSTPTGVVHNAAFKPTLTKFGERHPVTRGLSWKKDQEWGDWLRQVSVMPESGYTVMKGVEDEPLLILDRVGKGRIAHLTSDLIWLWARGYDGGGPQADLLRRLAHWLMKEPELEENALEIKVEGKDLIIKKRSLEDKKPHNIKMIHPSGREQEIELEPFDNGLAQKKITVSQLGIYKFKSEDLERAALVGAYNPPELEAVVTTDEKVRELVKATAGSVSWLSKGEPAIRAMPPNSDFSGYGWIGLRKNNDYIVTGLTTKSLLSEFWLLVILGGVLALTWWRESRLD